VVKKCNTARSLASPARLHPVRAPWTRESVSAAYVCVCRCVRVCVWGGCHVTASSAGSSRRLFFVRMFFNPSFTKPSHVLSSSSVLRCEVVNARERSAQLLRRLDARSGPHAHARTRRPANDRRQRRACHADRRLADMKPPSSNGPAAVCAHRAAARGVGASSRTRGHELEAFLVLTPVTVLPGRPWLARRLASGCGPTCRRCPHN